MSGAVVPHPRRQDAPQMRALERVRARGWHVVYRDGEVNHCPGCGRSHWWVGRASAECGFCATALPIVRSLTGEAP